MSPSPRPELVADGYAPSRPRWAQLATSADHKDVGQILICGALGFLFIALVELMLMRIQLLVPENTFLSPVGFNRMLSLYGASAIFLFALPLAVGLFYYVAPLQIGARGTALPRLGQIGLGPLGRRRNRALRDLSLHPVRGRRQPAGTTQRGRLPRQQRRRRLGYRDRARDPRLRLPLDQPRRDAADDAGAGDGLAPASGLRLGGSRRLLVDGRDRPGPAGGADDADDRPPLRRHLLRRRLRRRAAPLAAPELDLLHRHLHADPDLRLRRDRRNRRDLRPQTALQPHRGDGLAGRDRGRSGPSPGCRTC